MVKTIIRNLIIILVMSLFLGSCSNVFNTPSTGDTEKTVTFENSFDFVVENIAPSFWTSGDMQPNACLNFWIFFEETDLVASDFASIQMTDPNGAVWSFTGDNIESYFSSEYSYFGGFIRCFTADYSDNYSVLAIGNYTFTAELTNGNSDTLTAVITDPGSTSANGDYMYTESYTQTPGTGYVALPEQAQVSSASVASSTLTVEFSVNSPIVYSGYIWLFDANQDYIGAAPGGDGYFVDYGSGNVNTDVFADSKFYTDGTENTFTINESSIDFAESYSLSDAAGLHIILTDGEQYLETSYNGFHARSISGYTQIQ
ncbi:MAG: hypothetical protein ACLFR1_02710 [Spirochaetia bacterium]